MKIKGSGFFKQIMSLLSSIAKAKSLAIKSKTSAVKARLIMFSLIKNRKVLLGSISNKIQSILGQHDKDSQNGDVEDQSRAIVLYNAMSTENIETVHYDYNDDDGKYPDLTHSLFDGDDDQCDFVDQGGSIIDLVRNSKEEEGQKFSLEDEIDHVADLFILRFHKQIKLQKLDSFKRFQEMLARGT